MNAVNHVTVGLYLCNEALLNNISIILVLLSIKTNFVFPLTNSIYKNNCHNTKYTHTI